MHGNNGISNNDDDSDGDEDDDDDDDDLFVNPNHQKTTCYVDSDSSDESEDNEQWYLKISSVRQQKQGLQYKNTCPLVELTA